MIYQLKVTVKGLKPPVWRRLQLDGRTTFAQLHEVLQIVFGWPDLFLHSTAMTRSGGQKGLAYIDPQDEETDVSPFPPEQYDEEEETLEEWFLTEKDRAIYTYDFRENWEHEIVLEQIHPPEAGVHYPACVKAMRDVPLGLDDEEPDTGWRERTDELNDMLGELDFGHDGEMDANKFDWSRLIEEAQTLNDAAPWQYLHDGQVFGVFDPEAGQNLYCSILGAGGQEYGLAVYIGDDGLDALRMTLDETLGEDFLMKQRSILLSFSDRNELDDMDAAFLKRYGTVRSGRKQNVQLRSLKPGMLPWMIDSEEGRILHLVIRETLAILKHVRGGLEIPLYEGGNELLFRIPQQDGSSPAWKTVLAQMKGPASAKRTTLYVSELDVKRAARLKTSKKTIQFGAFMVPMTTQEKPGDRPFFPIMAAAIDKGTYEAIYHDMTKADTQDIDVQSIFLQMLFEMKALPATVELTPDMADRLAPVTDRLPIRLRILDELDGLEAFREYVTAMSME